MLRDETGKKYGRLTVVERVKMPGEKCAHWLCKCDCGGVKIARGVDLRSGSTQSCGCLKRENIKNLKKARRSCAYDFTGERFGRLLVLHKGGKCASGSRWICRCDCGNIADVRGVCLKYGYTQSCGCLRREKSVENGRKLHEKKRELSSERDRVGDAERQSR